MSTSCIYYLPSFTYINSSSLVYNLFNSLHSFHVGSGCSDPHAFSKALQLAKEVFMNGAELGYNMNILDIGGGFASETTNNYGVVAFSLVCSFVISLCMYDEQSGKVTNPPPPLSLPSFHSPPPPKREVQGHKMRECDPTPCAN